MQNSTRCYFIAGIKISFSGIKTSSLRIQRAERKRKTVQKFNQSYRLRHRPFDFAHQASHGARCNWKLVVSSAHCELQINILISEKRKGTIFQRLIKSYRINFRVKEFVCVCGVISIWSAANESARRIPYRPILIGWKPAIPSFFSSSICQVNVVIILIISMNILLELIDCSLDFSLIFDCTVIVPIRRTFCHLKVQPKVDDSNRKSKRERKR